MSEPSEERGSASAGPSEARASASTVGPSEASGNASTAGASIGTSGNMSAVKDAVPASRETTSEPSEERGSASVGPWEASGSASAGKQFYQLANQYWGGYFNGQA